MSQIKWTKARRKLLQEIEVAEMVQHMQSKGRMLSKVTLRAVIAAYIKRYNPPAKPDPRQSRWKDPKGRPQFDEDDSATLLKRISEDAVNSAKKG